MTRHNVDLSENGSAHKPVGWSIGEWLRYLRRRRGWSQGDLARNMVAVAADFGGTAELRSLKPMISKWENNKIEPDQYNRHLLAETLGVDVAELGLSVNPFFAWRKRVKAA